MARRMGAERYGQALAALACACAPVLMVIFGFYSLNAIEIFLVSLCCLLLVEILIGERQELWWLVGALFGLAIMNKHTATMFAAAAAVGWLATRQRWMLGQRALWGGVSVATLIVLPNLLWQQVHGWPSLEFYRSAAAKNIPTPALQAFVNQVLSMNPATLPIWTAGAWLLLRDRRLRPLGLAFALLFAAMVFSGQSRQDRIAGFVPLVMAAGATFWDSSHRRRLRALIAALPLTLAVGLSPTFLPILPPPQLASYSAALGVVPELEEHDDTLRLPQWFGDRLDWEPFVREIEGIVAQLPAAERRRAIVLTRTYGAAAPLELLGRDLPPVHAPHNNYHLWGPPAPFDVVIAVQYSQAELSEHFATVVQVGEIRCDYCRYWRRPTPVYAARGLERPLADLWHQLELYL